MEPDLLPSVGMTTGRWVFAGLCALWVAGCSAADPGVEGLTRGNRSDGGGGGGSDSGVKVDGGGSDGGSGADSGTPDSGAPTAFTGAGGYTSQKPATSAKSIHQMKGVGTVPSKSVACQSCHGNGGGAPEFFFAGTIFTDQAGTMPAVDVEVRARGTDGVGYTAHSDDDGNFWFKKGMATLAFPCTTGARDGQMNVALMKGTIANGDCNSGACHAGGQGAIHLP